MNTTGIGKNASAVRARTIFIGTDQRGHDYFCKTERDPEDIILIHDGERVMVDDLDEFNIGDVVATVADEIGWAVIEYGWRAYDKPIPRKYE